MGNLRRVAFLTGTRADFGKIKSLIRTLIEAPPDFEVHIFATGMHMDPKYGYTVEEIHKCGFPNIYRFINATPGWMDRSLSHTIHGFGDYVRLINPELIVVHGDRIEALAGAMVGALNNILVAHVEGGEVSGTVDELIRHSVSKLSHVHFVSNESARRRLVQIGETPESIHVIGSPDIDIMNSTDLPSIDTVLAHYSIPFRQFGILAYHPVTTMRLQDVQHDAEQLAAAVASSSRNVIAIYPNNDRGSDLILEEYQRTLQSLPNIRLFPSIRFEYMLVLLKNAEFVLGNSSMGIREAPFYGVPTINVGTRQHGRSNNPNIIHVPADKIQVAQAIQKTSSLQSQLIPVAEFGDGTSHKRFRRVLEDPNFWQTSVQKHFFDLRFHEAA